MYRKVTLGFHPLQAVLVQGVSRENGHIAHAAPLNYVVILV